MAKAPGTTKMGNSPLKHMPGNATKTHQPSQDRTLKVAGTRAGYSPKAHTQHEQLDKFAAAQGYNGGGKGTKTPPHRDNLSFHGREPKIMGANQTTSIVASRKTYGKNTPEAAGGNSKASPKTRHTNNPGSGY